MNMNIGPSSSSSSTYGTYYDPFYPNGGPTTWSSYPGPPPPPQSSATSSGPGSCLIGPVGPKGLPPHFTPVHQQRRKRRVLFTQAQVRSSRFEKEPLITILIETSVALFLLLAEYDDP